MNVSIPRIGYELTQGHHVLIAGATGSGKSTLVDGIMMAIASQGNAIEYGIIDLKQVSLMKWENFPRCFQYAITPDDALDLLKYVRRIMYERLSELREKRLDKWDGGKMYVIIDEAAELFDTVKESKDLVKELTRLARATGIFIIMATQSPNRKTLSADIKLNFTTLVGLRCAEAIESKQIIGKKGCEELPLYGFCYVKYPDGSLEKKEIPMVKEEQRQNLWQAFNLEYQP